MKLQRKRFGKTYSFAINFIVRHLENRRRDHRKWEHHHVMSHLTAGLAAESLS
jgi:hypothetical protein